MTTIDLDTDQCSTTTSSYSYDDAGNFTNNSAMGTANNVNEYSNFTYNSRHDLTDDGTYSYGYDALNRLISVTPDNPTDSSVHERCTATTPQGRMAWEQDENWGIGPSCAPAWIPGNSYTFVWAGNELEAKLDGSGNVLQKYTWAPDENGQPKIQEFNMTLSSSSAVDYALTYDASGSVDDEFVASTGQEVASFSFAPFGALISATGPGVSICPVGFKGYQTNFAVDPNLAMAQPAPGYTIGRDINTAYGIFQQPDPSGLNGGINIGGEAFNDDPINKSDPNGLAASSTQPTAAQQDAVTNMMLGGQSPMTQDQFTQFMIDGTKEPNPPWMPDWNFDFDAVESRLSDLYKKLNNDFPSNIWQKTPASVGKDYQDILNELISVRNEEQKRENYHWNRTHPGPNNLSGGDSMTAAEHRKAHEYWRQNRERIDDRIKDELDSAKRNGFTFTPVQAGVAPTDPVRLHHAWAKYLGGQEEQDLVPLSKSLHDAYHKGLDQIAGRWRGTAYYENLPPEELNVLLKKVAQYTQDFDAKNGTALYKAMLKEGFPSP